MDYKEFSETYIPLGDGLYRLAFHFLESEEDARDALQDLFIKLWNSRDALDSVHNPRGYSLTMMKNLCMDRLRRAERKNGAQMPPDLASGERSDASLQSAERIRKIKEAIGRLPQAQREVIEMKMEGLSYQEMAEKTGKAPLTLRVLLSNGRKKLNELI